MLRRGAFQIKKIAKTRVVASQCPLLSSLCSCMLYANALHHRHYHDHHARSLSHKEEWWAEIAQDVDWFEVSTYIFVRERHHEIDSI